MGPSELFQVTKRLKTEFPWMVEAQFFERVDSTQKRIVKFLPKTGEGGVMVMAESQTKAIGRQGRIWVSPPGGIWFTLGLPLKSISLEAAASFSPVSALIVTQSLKAVNNLECEFKWPNDVICQGKKIAGILLNTTIKFKKGWMLLGVGVNVNNELPGALSKEATSISKVRGQTQGRSRLIEAVLDAIWTAWEEFDKTGFGPYQKAAESCLSGVGKSTRILIGNTETQGTITGIDPQGGLLLKSPSGTKTIHAGEIVGQPA